MPDAVPTVTEDGDERFIREWADDRDLSEFLVTVFVSDRKPTPEG